MKTPIQDTPTFKFALNAARELEKLHPSNLTVAEHIHTCMLAVGALLEYGPENDMVNDVGQRLGALMAFLDQLQQPAG